jgi:hypothetical protein
MPKKTCFLGNAGDSVADAVPWVLLGIAGGVGLYWLLKPKEKTVPGKTQALRRPALSPSRYADLDSVDARFRQIGELYRMGYLNPAQTLGEFATLEAAARNLENQDAEKAGEILARIGAYRNEISQYVGSSAVVMQGIRRYPIAN